MARVLDTSRKNWPVLPARIRWPLLSVAVPAWCVLRLSGLGCRSPAFAQAQALRRGHRRSNFAGGSARRPSAESPRLEGLIALKGVSRRTKKIKIAQNIVQVRKMGPFQYSSKPWQKEMKKVKKVAEQDAWLNEFMSYSRPMPVGGEYVMPEDVVRQHLDDIYGAEPTLHTLFEQIQGEERVSYTEFRNLNSLRKKREPSKVAGSRPRRDRLRVPNIGGVAKYIGAMPRGKLRDNHQEGVVGGSLEKPEDVWVSGASVSYNFDSEDHTLL